MNRRLNSFLVIGVGVLLQACSGGGGGASAGGGGEFRLVSTNLNNAETWPINQAMEFTFSDEVDFSSISANTLSIRTPAGAPAQGTYFLKPGDPTTIVFQPNCPTRPDLSDAGLRAGTLPSGEQRRYNVVLMGLSSLTENVLRSRFNVGLDITQQRFFFTPSTTAASDAFVDTSPLTAPRPIVRNAGSTLTDATYIELGGDPGNRQYFERQLDGSVQTADPTFELPLNLYSDVSSQIAVVIEFDQAVSPALANLTDTNLRLEFEDGQGGFVPLDTRVTLVRNCTLTGSRVRLEPIGILPPSDGTTPIRVRAVVGSSFSDIAGQQGDQDLVNFAIATTRATAFNGLTPPDDLADEFLESFLVGGTDPDSFEDTEALALTAPAAWGAGKLSAGFDFQGTGGPNGDFDFVLGVDQTFTFDTTFTAVNGGPGGVPSTTQNATGGVLDVRDFILQTGSIFQLQGPNIFQLNATGDVIIDGLLDVSGQRAANVGTLNTGNQKESGGIGTAGGGNGGDASTVLNNATPRGSTGFGAFNAPFGGGQGGESGFRRGGNVDRRRPGGGGGGRFGVYPESLGINRVVGSDGADGVEETTGAESNEMPAAGGVIGPAPFFDNTDENDHFGLRPFPDISGTRIVRGELTRIWAGSGGGGGGDAVNSNNFPGNDWDPGRDEKGGGGGGGGGGCNIRALGTIRFGGNGRIQVNGGIGANGENTNFLDHVGGSGGGGSGGHLVIETATRLDLTDNGLNSGVANRLYLQAQGIRGGVGQAGTNGNPPATASGGGFGSGGRIQIHVPDPLIPPDIFGSSAGVWLPDGGELSNFSRPEAFQMVPTFGSLSRAQSRWISIGGADRNPSGALDQLAFTFGGTNPADGQVLATAGQVDELTPLLTGTVSGNISSPSAFQLRIIGPALDPLINDLGVPSDDIYLRTPSLLKNFLLRLTFGVSVNREFNVADAVYDDDLNELTITVADEGISIADVLGEVAPSVPNFDLIPRFFRISTDGADGVIPTGGSVNIRFSATGANPDGTPDADNLLISSSGDVSTFNALDAGDIRFFRFEVEFNLGAVDSDTKPIDIDFLRLPFRF